MHNKVSLKIFFTIILFTLSASAVQATDVALIMEDASSPTDAITSTLNSLSLSYDLIKDSQVPSTDFSQYSVLLVLEKISKKDYLQLHKYNAIILDRDIADEAWTLHSTGQTANRNIKIINQDSFLLNGINIPNNDELQIYSPSGEIHYLTLNGNSEITPVANRVGYTRTVLGYSIETGDKIIKRIFFGAPETEKWNSNAEKILENALTWTLAEVDQDQDGFTYENDCNDNDETINPNAQEIPYDNIDQDCSGFDLLDADTDGYCKQGTFIQNAFFQCPSETGTIGTDCDDENAETNLENPNPESNCKNDAPTFTFIPQDLSFMESNLVEFTLEATDPENDFLTFSIDDPRFAISGNKFSWQTDYNDEGIYQFEVSVTDGEFTNTETIELKITNLNQPPVLTQIPDLSWNEDTQYTIFLEDYFTDYDSTDLEFGIEDSSQEIELTLDSNEITFNPPENFAGTAWAIFYAKDEQSKTLSNKVNLNILPINDAPKLNEAIPSQSWNEDASLPKAINLKNYFTDVDSELTFTATGNSQVIISISNGIVSFSAPENFAGTEQIYFTASDGEFQIDSNIITLTIFEEGEIPVFQPLTCKTNIDEDAEYTCTLKATDVENNDLIFSVTNQKNAICEISGNTLTYKSKENYFGTASCDLEVSDIHGSDTQTLALNIASVNDAPTITSFSPTSSIVSLIQGENKIFSLEAEDIESDVEIFWYLDGNKYNQISENNFVFQENKGNYLLESKATDGELQTTQTWNVIVGLISEFTCEEVSGFECNEDQICPTSLLGVKDSDSCCSSVCIPKFKDAEYCEVLDENLEIKITDPDSGDKLELGKIEKIEFKIYNKLEKDQKFDIEVHLYNLNEDTSESKIETKVKIEEGKSRTLRLDLEIPADLDLDDNYAIFVSAKDDSCTQAYTNLELERPDEMIKISRFEIPEKAECGQRINANFKIENLGDEDQDIEFQILSRKLNIDETTEFELERFGNEDTESGEFTFLIPDDTESGTYEITATAVFDTSRREKTSAKIEISCPSEIYRETTIGSDLEEKISLNKVHGKSEPSQIKKTNEYLPVAFLMMLNLVLVASAGVLYMAHRKRYE